MHIAMKTFFYTAAGHLEFSLDPFLLNRFEIECSIDFESIKNYIEQNEPYDGMVFFDATCLDGPTLLQLSKQIQSAYQVFVDPSASLAAFIIQNKSELFVCDYVSERFGEKQFKACLDRFKNSIGAVAQNGIFGNYIVLNEKGERTFVHLNDINLIEGFGAYTKVYTTAKVYVVSKTLQKFLNLLPDYFVRTHRSYAVHLMHVKNITGNTLVMNNGSKAKASRLGAQTLMARMVLAS